MTVSIDTTGSKETKQNINYPLFNDNDNLELPSDQGLLHMTQQFKQKLYKQADNANQFSLDGFNSCNGGYLATQTAPCGIKVRMRIDEYKQLVWEAQVPFKAIYGVNELPATYAGKPVSVCFTVKGYKRNAPKGNDNTANNDPNMSGTTFGNNSRQRSMGSGARSAESPVQHMFETTKTWKHFELEYR